MYVYWNLFIYFLFIYILKLFYIYILFLVFRIWVTSFENKEVQNDICNSCFVQVFRFSHSHHLNVITMCTLCVMIIMHLPELHVIVFWLCLKMIGVLADIWRNDREVQSVDGQWRYRVPDRLQSYHLQLWYNMDGGPRSPRRTEATVEVRSVIVS